MGQALGFLTKSFDFNFGSFSLPFSYWQALAIVVLLFLLVLTLAQVRHHFVNWSFKGAVFGLFFGFLLALILEGFLIIGGKTALTELLGWKNAPKPFSVALGAGRDKLVQVLGLEAQIPQSLAKDDVTVGATLEVIQSLNPNDLKKLKTLLCQP